MDIEASLAYGIAITDDLGEKLDHVPQGLFDFAANFELYGDRETSPLPKGFTYMATEVDPAIVLGVVVPTGKKGLTFQDVSEAVNVHEQFLAALVTLPEEMRILVEGMNCLPRLELMYRNW